MAKRPEEEQPQAMQSMDQTGQSVDPVAGMGPPPPPNGIDEQPQAAPPNPFPNTQPPQQTTPEMGPPEPTQRDRRLDELAAEKERFNKLMTERARARRGLAPLDEQARSAATGGGEAAATYRAGPKQTQPGQAATGQQAGVQPATGQYQTGQTVQLSGMPSGHESTTVYALDNDVALPGGADMSVEDFGAAFQQLNPGRTKMDAVQALAREPGPTGNAARALLRDSGAAAGQPLSAAQRDQIEAQLAGRADELLRSHARSMESSIAQGSTRIARQQEAERKAAEAAAEEERKRQEEIRKAAIKNAEAKYGTDEYVGRSMESLIQDEIAYETSKQQFIAGQGEAPTRPVDTSNAIDVPSYEVAPDSVPADAMPEGAYIDPQNGTLKYQNEQLPADLPAAMIDAPGREGGKQVVPIVQTDRQVGMLPPGQAYILDGKLYFRGTPGRPSKDGGVAETTGSKAKPDKVEISAADVERDLLRQKTSPIESAMRSTQGQIDRYTEVLKNQTDPGMREQIQYEIDKLNEELQNQQQSLEEANTVTNEEIIAEMDKRKARSEELQQLQENWMFGKGDPATVGKITAAALPPVRSEIMTRSGSMLDIDGVRVPYSTDTNGSIVVDPQTPEQILAIEQNAEGNVVTANMGKDAVSAVSSATYQRTNDIMSELKKNAQDNNMMMISGSPSDQRRIIDRLKEYLVAKYNPDQRDMPMLIDGMLESIGFSAPTEGVMDAQSLLAAQSISARDARDEYHTNIRRENRENEKIERGRGGAFYIGDALNTAFGGGFSPNR